MVHFTIGASSGRQGSRTLISVGRTALAERPGQPYPATFHSVDPPGIEPGFPACRAGVVPLDHEPVQSGEWGSNHVLLLPRQADYRFPTPCKWTARELHPHFRRAEPAPSCWTSSPVIPDGLEPSLPGCGPGVVAAGPRDHCSSRGGNRTHNRSPGSRPGRFAGLRTRPSSCGGRIRTGVERLMRPCWKPDSSPLRSDQGESRTPTPVRHGVLSAACLPVPPLGHSVARMGIEPISPA
jgi:hypothetical protein